jgi:hypothetical protein
LATEACDTILRGRLLEGVGVVHFKSALLSGSPPPDCVIAGDSKAGRQIIPEILNGSACRKAVNIAYDSINLPSTVDILKRHSLLGSGRKIVIGLSSWQLFELEKDSYVPYLSSWEKLAFFRSVDSAMNLLFFYRQYLPKIFENPEKVPPEENVDLSMNGFQPVPPDWASLMSKRLEVKYLRQEIIPGKARVFKNSLEQLANSSAEVYLVLGPLSPNLRNHYAEIKNKREDLFAKFTLESLSKYKNIRFLDLYHFTSIQDEGEFVDGNHLTPAAARIFSAEIAKRML